ncbi:MAG: hypothetical protein R3C11_07470 [Planctomycetaceae bacterium]
MSESNKEDVAEPVFPKLVPKSQMNFEIMNGLPQLGALVIIFVFFAIAEN